MSKPTLHEYIRPVLTIFEDGARHSYEEVFRVLGERYDLIRRDTPKRVTMMVNAALGYLARAQVLTVTNRREYAITERGYELLRTGPQLITLAELRKFPEFDEFIRSRYRGSVTRCGDAASANSVPEDAIEEAYHQYNTELAERLLTRVKQCSWQFFEMIVKDLLVAMGYGDPSDEGTMCKGPGDEGIDGVIKADRLGLELICIQAKKWEQRVGRPEVQKFAGSLESRRAKKGVFITTSGFSDEARTYVQQIEKRIVLIDGPELARLMIEYDIGVSDSSSYRLKIIDSDYFGGSAN